MHGETGVRKELEEPKRRADPSLRWGRPPISEPPARLRPWHLRLASDLHNTGAEPPRANLKQEQGAADVPRGPTIVFWDSEPPADIVLRDAQKSLGLSARAIALMTKM